MTVREADGALFLAPRLPRQREKIEAILKPVVRLGCDASRKPKPWESKFGGL